MFFVYKSVKVHYLEYINSSLLPPVVFLHGWGGDIRSFDYFARALSCFRSCIVLSFPPFGRSQEPTSPWGVQDYTDLVVALLDSLGYKECDIVAHSFGGRVALQMCCDKKVHINKLLLTSSAGIGKKSIGKKIKIVHYKIIKFLSKIHLYSKNKLEKMGSEEYKNLSPVMKKTFVNIVNYDQTPLLKHINAQTLLFWGKRDKDTPFYFTKIFKKNINNCEVIETNGTHFAYIEFSDLFLRVMISFLKE